MDLFVGRKGSRFSNDILRADFTSYFTCLVHHHTFNTLNKSCSKVSNAMENILMHRIRQRRQAHLFVSDQIDNFFNTTRIK